MVVVEAVVALLPWVAVGTAVLLVAFIFVPGFWDKVRRQAWCEKQPRMLITVVFTAHLQC